MAVLYVKAYTREDGHFYRLLDQSHEGLASDIWKNFENFTKVTDDDVFLMEQKIKENREKSWKCLPVYCCI